MNAIRMMKIDFFIRKWCQRRDLNPRPKAYESSALPLSYSGNTGQIILRRRRLVSRVRKTSNSKLQTTGKLQTPSSKLQGNFKFQAPSTRRSSKPQSEE